MNNRTGSIARRLNAALVRRNFVRTLLADLFVVLLVIATWCLTVEAAHGGHITDVSGRAFAGYAEAGDYAVRFVSDLVRTDGEPLAQVVRENALIFRGTVYRFTIGGTAYEESAAEILTAVSAAAAVILLLQFLQFILRHFTGRGLIKRYLRPIDEVALSAERLSSNDRTEVDSLAHAINAIDDSDKRVAVHDSELGGLEAAVNNMLRRLEESKRKQIRFVDDASHELRTPIAVIQGYVNMLDRWGKDDPTVMEESIAAIKNESDHMKTLIDQLLFLARGDMERHIIHRIPLDANELLEEVAEESRMIDREHEYRFETDGQPRTVRADPAMMKQALRVLVDNASKYTPSGGTIRLRSYERGGSVCMEVSDTGIGIPNDELPRIFDRFYRGQNLRGDSNGGSGLGLSIAKWIVEEHGGSITAVSSEGIGTKMTVEVKYDPICGGDAGDGAGGDGETGGTF